MTKRNYTKAQDRKDVTAHLLKAGETGMYGDIVVRAVKRTENVCFGCCFGRGSCTLVKCKGRTPREDIAFKILDSNCKINNNYID